MKPIIFSLAFLIMMLSSSFIQAKPPLSEDNRAGYSLPQAVKNIKKRTQGRILTADTIKRKGLFFHKVKVLLPNGKVRIIRVKAK